MTIDADVVRGRCGEIEQGLERLARIRSDDRRFGTDESITRTVCTRRPAGRRAAGGVSRGGICRRFLCDFCRMCPIMGAVSAGNTPSAKPQHA
jgi:hypothetical protein